VSGAGIGSYFGSPRIVCEIPGELRGNLQLSEVFLLLFLSGEFSRLDYDLGELTVRGDPSLGID
jgi:hypothetical protein